MKASPVARSLSTHDALGRLVDRRRLVAAEPGPDDRLSLGPPRQLGEHVAHVLGGGAARLEPRTQIGWNSRPERSFG